MKERKRPPWLRWVMLIVALGLCWAIWDDMELYARLEEQAIFSPAEWARAWNRRRGLSAIFGLL